MRVSLELEKEETLKCNKCGKLIQGIANFAYLDIDESNLNITEVYCFECTSDSSEQTIPKEAS